MTKLNRGMGRVGKKNQGRRELPSCESESDVKTEMIMKLWPANIHTGSKITALLLLIVKCILLSNPWIADPRRKRHPISHRGGDPAESEI